MSVESIELTNTLGLLDEEDMAFCRKCYIGVDVNPKSFVCECLCGNLYAICPKCKSCADINVDKLSGICKKCNCEFAMCPKCNSYAYMDEDNCGYTCENCRYNFAICPKCHKYAFLNNKHTPGKKYICKRKKCIPAKCDSQDCIFKNFKPKDCTNECSPEAKYKHCNRNDCLTEYCINEGCGKRIIPYIISRLKEKANIKERAKFLKNEKNIPYWKIVEQLYDEYNKTYSKSAINYWVKGRRKKKNK